MSRDPTIEYRTISLGMKFRIHSDLSTAVWHSKTQRCLSVEIREEKFSQSNPPLIYHLLATLHKLFICSKTL